MPKFGQKGAVPLLILIAVVGIVAVLTISSVAPFKDQLLSGLFPKDQSQAADQVPRYGVFETTLNYSTSGITEPQNLDLVKVNAAFTSPTNKTLNVEGFYYDTDTYKVRFTPAEVGDYNYTITIQGPNGNPAPTTGSFTSIASNAKGFIKIHPTMPNKFIFEDGSAFFGFGMNDCWGINLTKNPADPVRIAVGSSGYFNPSGFIEPLGEGGRRDADLYFKKYADSGFNLFRLNHGNCAPYLLYTQTSSLIESGKPIDDMLLAAKNSGFHTLYAFSDLHHYPHTDPNLSLELKRQIRYTLARFGAYVDMWEWSNETDATVISDSFLAYVSSFMRSVDPYPRLLTNSYPRVTDNQFLDFQSTHGQTDYFNFQTPGKSGNMAHMNGEGYVGALVPNCASSTTPQTNLTEEYFKYQAWNAYFSHNGVFWWGGSDGYPNCLNTYMGSIERGYNKILADFAFNIPADATNSFIAGDPQVAILTSSKVVAAYISTNPSNTGTRTKTFTTNVPFNGTAQWINPDNGNVLQTFSVTAGSRPFTTPSFGLDIALKIIDPNAGLPNPTPIPTPIPDSQAPTDITGLAARSLPIFNPSNPNINWTPVQLSWNPASDNQPGLLYRIYRNNLHFGTTKYPLMELPDNFSTTYTYKVEAIDQAGNVGSSQTITYTNVPKTGPFSSPLPYPSISPTPPPSTPPSPSPSPSPSPTTAASPSPLPSATKQGDIDGNNDIDIFDYNILLTDFGKTGNFPADIDKSGKVDIFDYNILLTNFGK